MIQKAKEEECVVDATQGRLTRAVIITNAGIYRLFCVTAGYTDWQI